jgi:hypothetical protein
LQTTRGYVAVVDEDLIRHYQTFLDRRRAQRPAEEYRPTTAAEWIDRDCDGAAAESSAGCPEAGTSRAIHKGCNCVGDGVGIRRARAGRVTRASSRPNALHVTLYATDPRSRLKDLDPQVLTVARGRFGLHRTITAGHWRACPRRSSPMS